MSLFYNFKRLTLILNNIRQTGPPNRGEFYMTLSFFLWNKQCLAISVFLILMWCWCAKKIKYFPICETYSEVQINSVLHLLHYDAGDCSSDACSPKRSQFPPFFPHCIWTFFPRKTLTLSSYNYDFIVITFFHTIWLFFKRTITTLFYQHFGFILINFETLFLKTGILFSLWP